MGLNPKQKLFVKEYIIDKNASRAARDAGYSKKVAKEIGARLLTNVNVKAAVEAGLQKQLDAADITAREVIQELAALAKVKLTRKGLVRPGNKIHALEILAKHFKLLTDKIETSGPDGGPQVILTMPANGSEAKPKVEEPKDG